MMAPPTTYQNGSFGTWPDWYLLLSLLPFIALTVTRWIITGHWHFGPRW
jgi:hypothetical protein